MDLKTLCELNGLSGDERAVRAAILEEARECCDAVTIDKMGNVVAFKHGTRHDTQQVVLCAHMDEVGFVIWGATEEGLLRFLPVGGMDPRVCVSKHVVAGDSGLRGVIGAMARHLQTEEDKKRVLDFDHLYIDIGAADRREALDRCPEGTYFYFDAVYETYGEDCVVSKALDDRVGCYNMLRLMKKRYPCDVTYVFTCQEEVGSRGAFGAAWDAASAQTIVLEGTAANDLGCVPETQQVIRLGRGVGISFMDLTTIADQDLFNRLVDLGESFEVPYQIKSGVTGVNDARAFQRVAEGGSVCVLSVPCRYIHGPSSVARLSDINAQYLLIRTFLENS